MDEDWPTLAERRSEVARKAAPIIRNFLDDANLSLADAHRLLGLIDKGSVTWTTLSI